MDPQLRTDAAAERVLALSGRPYDTEFRRIARVTDLSGAAFTLIDPSTESIPPSTWQPAGTG